MASSSSGGSGSGGPSGGSRPPGSGGYSSGQPPRGGSAGGGDQPPFSSSGRPTRPTAPVGQERTVSYQREEERYWTDYLRIALPVIGLLLMLGLFWYWAQSLIGDDDDEQPTQVSEILSPETPTPTEQLPVSITATPGGNEAAQTDTGEDAEPTETPTDETDGTTGQQADEQDGADQAEPDADDVEQPLDEQDDAEEEGRFAVNDAVVVATDVLNMRSEPSTDSDVVVELLEGAELTVVGETVPGENYFWVEVEDIEGNVGYVADEFLELSE
ncbi:MAG: SH3 domain-containing protein [Thermomicrobiales bacterium]